jgi:hypothetical protein
MDILANERRYGILSIDEAVGIYAQFLRSRYWSVAELHARERARDAEEAGDGDGVVIWTRVADLAT